MPLFLRSALHRVVPANFRNPVGLAWRLIRGGDPAALFAMKSAALGLAATPFDWLLRPFEYAACRSRETPKKPLIFVCGGPRTGTTVTAQTLIRHLPVAWFDNLTSIFPRSPIVARRLFRRKPREVSSVDYHSFYGKSVGWSAPNDALYFWDRWVGSDRHRIPEGLKPGADVRMRRFFAAWEHETGRPLLNKCNNLNTFAHLVADVLPTAHFLCLTRDPLFHAQSLLKARREIHGSDDVAYGLTDTHAADPVEDVCRQALFHQRMASTQQGRIGAERFHVVSYEEFCARPIELVKSVGRSILGLENLDVPPIEPFKAANTVKIPPADFDALTRGLAAVESAGESMDERHPVPVAEGAV